MSRSLRRSARIASLVAMLACTTPIALVAQSTENVLPSERGFHSELSVGGEIPNSLAHLYSVAIAARIQPWEHGAFRLAAQYFDRSNATVWPSYTSSGAPSGSQKLVERDHSLAFFGTIDVPFRVGSVVSIAPSAGIGVVPIGRVSGNYPATPGAQSPTTYSRSSVDALLYRGIALRYRKLVIEKQWIIKLGASGGDRARRYSPFLVGVRW
jgi:hypothetical protein